MSAEPIPPIVIDDLGELLIYPTVEIACLEVEAIDAREGVLKAFDSDGHPLDFGAQGEVVSLTLQPGTEPNPADLERRLRRYMSVEWLTAMGLTDLEGGPLSQILRSLLQYQQGENSTPKLGWARRAVVWFKRLVSRG